MCHVLLWGSHQSHFWRNWKKNIFLHFVPFEHRKNPKSCGGSLEKGKGKKSNQALAQVFSGRGREKVNEESWKKGREKRVKKIGKKYSKTRVAKK